jgi:hypothetical protein
LNEGFAQLLGGTPGGAHSADVEDVDRPVGEDGLLLREIGKVGDFDADLIAAT